jgi:N-acetylglucosamine-6-sulfatase
MLTRRQALWALTGGSLLSAALCGRRARAEPPPDILVILSDNHRWDAMSGMGHRFVRTPHLDRLAREGVRFANAYCTTPLCSPARASFLTGLYAWRHGVRNNADRAVWDERHVTFLELLRRQRGYRTAFIGKWHMPGSGLPRLRGVDRFVTFTVNEGQGRYFDCPLVVDGRPEASRHAYLTEELTARAIAFLEEAGDAPACLYLSHKAAHHPWRPAPDLDGIYADQPVPMPPGANSWTGLTNGQIWGGFDRSIESAYRAYMETVTSLDREIGRLLAHLEARGRLDRTVVVYASDNGFLFGEHRRVELRWPFEEVIRIPLLVRYPPTVAALGQPRRQMALNIDLAPTLLELAGAEVPADMQGLSLVAALRSAAAPGRRAWLVENAREFPYRVPSYQGVHTDQYLYVEYDGAPATLHDVAADPQQQRDLIDSAAGARVLPELRATLAALRRGQRFDGA